MLCSFNKLLLTLLLSTCTHNWGFYELKKELRQVVIWGHKLHSHTHSYIHWGFHRAFQHLGFKTLWLDDKDNVANINFSKTLFLTEGQVDKKIPIRPDCFYILHYPRNIKKYQGLFDQNHAIYLNRILSLNKDYFTHKINENCYANINKKTIYIYWATDLLPHEVEANKKRIIFENNSKEINWVGTLSKSHYPNGNYDINQNMSKIDPFFKAARENNILIKKFTQNLDLKSHINKIKSSYLAPAIQGPLQCHQEYIPCRIFKNISYGHLGITNSPAVYNLFKKKIVFNDNTYQLFFDAQKALKNLPYGDRAFVMDLVKDHHTYINRINEILEFFELLSSRTIKND